MKIIRSNRLYCIDTIQSYNLRLGVFQFSMSEKIRTHIGLVVYSLVHNIHKAVHHVVKLVVHTKQLDARCNTQIDVSCLNYLTFVIISDWYTLGV